MQINPFVLQSSLGYYSFSHMLCLYFISLIFSPKNDYLLHFLAFILNGLSLEVEPSHWFISDFQGKNWTFLTLPKTFMFIHRFTREVNNNDPHLLIKRILFTKIQAMQEIETHGLHLLHHNHHSFDTKGFSLLTCLPLLCSQRRYLISPLIFFENIGFITIDQEIFIFSPRNNSISIQQLDFEMSLHMYIMVQLHILPHQRNQC